MNIFPVHASRNICLQNKFICLSDTKYTLMKWNSIIDSSFRIRLVATDPMSREIWCSEHRHFCEFFITANHTTDRHSLGALSALIKSHAVETLESKS
jgi:hypothetical protein